MSAPVGSLAAEAALLLDAIAGRLTALRPDAGQEMPEASAERPAGASGASGASGAPADAAAGVAADGVCPQCGHAATATATCTACPLCRLLAVLRGERPETTARLVEGALVVVQSLRALLPEPVNGAGEAGPSAADESPTSGSGLAGVAGVADPVQASPVPGGLQRIIVR